MKTLIVTAALTAFAFSGFAQTHGDNHHEMMNHSKSQPGQQDYLRTHSDRMSKDFNLNEDQSRRLNELNTTHYNEQSTLRQSSTDQAKWRQNEEAASRDYDKKLRGVLNDTQYKQYEANRQNYNFDYDHNNADTVAPTNKQGTTTPGNRQGTAQPNER